MALVRSLLQHDRNNNQKKLTRQYWVAITFKGDREREREREREGQTDRQTDRQADRQTDRQAGRQAGRQADGDRRQTRQ